MKVRAFVPPQRVVVHAAVAQTRHGKIAHGDMAPEWRFRCQFKMRSPLETARYRGLSLYSLAQENGRQCLAGDLFA